MRSGRGPPDVGARVPGGRRAPAAPVAARPSRAGAWSAAVVGGLVPVAAAVLYLLLGAPDAFSPQARQVAAQASEGHDFTPAQVEEMVTKLSAKLEQDPANVDGWVVLARTYYVMKRFPEASKAFEKAIALAPDVPDLLADYADTLGAAQGGTLEGRPLQLVNRALEVDPTHWKALALAGTAAFNRKDYRQAVGSRGRPKPPARCRCAPAAPASACLRPFPSTGTPGIRPDKIPFATMGVSPWRMSSTSHIPSKDSAKGFSRSIERLSLIHISEPTRPY